MISQKNQASNYYLKSVNKLSDYRSCVWFPMSMEDKLRMILYQTDQVEARLMIMLTIRQYGEIQQTGNFIFNALNIIKIYIKLYLIK